MKLRQGPHLVCSIPVRPGADWAETFDAVQRTALPLRKQVCPDAPFGLNLPLSATAARDLIDPTTLKAFQSWLDKAGCYVCSLEGWSCRPPQAETAGRPAPAQPDWTSTEALHYAKLLLDLLAALLPEDVAGSVQIGPTALKPLVQTNADAQAIQAHLWTCIEHVDQLRTRTHKTLRLSVGAQPGAYLATSSDVTLFFQKLQADRRDDERLETCLGVTYDACHSAAQFEDPAEALRHFQSFGIALTQIRLGAALALIATGPALQALKACLGESAPFGVVARSPEGHLQYYPNLSAALTQASPSESGPPPQWRLHFHWPLSSQPAAPLQSTAGHTSYLLGGVQSEPGLAAQIHLTAGDWDRLPRSIKGPSLTAHLLAEYKWTLAQVGGCTSG